MARYITTYTDGSEQHIPAEKVYCDTDCDQYVFHDSEHNTVALAPCRGVLSIVRMPESDSRPEFVVKLGGQDVDSAIETAVQKAADDPQAGTR